MARQVSRWLRWRKVQAALGIACGLVLLPVVYAALRPPAENWFWPIASMITEACLVFLLVFDIISLLIDREVERARAAGGLVLDRAAAEEARISPGRGIIGYAKRVATRRELAYKALKADIALLVSEGVISRSFSEIADDMGAAGYTERQVRQMVARACEEGLLELVKGKNRYRLVSTVKGMPAIADAVRARLPEIAEEPTRDVVSGQQSRSHSRRSRAPASSRSTHSSRTGSRARPVWVHPGGDAGDVPGLVPAVLRRLHLAGRLVTLYPKIDERTAVACIMTKRHVNKNDGAEQVTAVMIPVDAEVDVEKLRQVAAARHRLSGTARSIAPANADAASRLAGGACDLATGTRVLVDRALLEKENFYICAAEKNTWVFVRRAEVRRARIPEVSVLKEAAATKGANSA
ncbi:MAG: hypothetical protein Q6373_014030 [Candidatus Sigynarchaeota archaeon]